MFATEEAIHVGPGVDAAGTGHSSMLAVFATMERDRMREKAAESRQKLASLGRFAGGTPSFGYLSICLCHGAVACPHAGTKLCAGWVLAQSPGTDVCTALPVRARPAPRGGSSPGHLPSVRHGFRGPSPDCRGD